MQAIKKREQKLFNNSADRHSSFGIRKLTVGAASVLLGTTLLFGNGNTQEVHADALPSDPDQEDSHAAGAQAATQDINQAQAQESATSASSVINNTGSEQTSLPTNPGSNNQASQGSVQQSQTSNYQAPVQNSNVQSQANSVGQANTGVQSNGATQANTNNYQAPVQQAQTNTYQVSAPDNTQVANTYNSNASVANYQAANAQQADNYSSVNTYRASSPSTESQLSNAANSINAANTIHNDINSVTALPTNPDNGKAKALTAVEMSAAKLAAQFNKSANTDGMLDTSHVRTDDLSHTPVANTVYKLSNNLRDSKIDPAKLRALESNLMQINSINPYVSFASLSGNNNDPFAVSLAATDGSTTSSEEWSHGGGETPIEKEEIAMLPGIPADTASQLAAVKDGDGPHLTPSGHVRYSNHVTVWIKKYADGHESKPLMAITQRTVFAQPWESNNGQIKYNDWSTDKDSREVPSYNTMDELSSIPGLDLNGWVADKEQTDPIKVDVNTKDTVTKIYLRQQDVSVTVRYVVDKTQEVLREDSDIKGKPGTRIADKYQYQPILDKLSEMGYVPEVGGNPLAGPDGATFTNGAVFDITLEPGDATKKSTKTVKETVHYVDDKGNKVADDKVQTTDFTQIIHTNAVTGEQTGVSYEPDTAQKLPAIKSPTIAGMHPSQAEVPDQFVTGDTKDIDITVVYTKNADDVQPTSTTVSRLINYIDADTNKPIMDPNSVDTPLRKEQSVDITGKMVHTLGTDKSTAVTTWDSNQKFDAVPNPVINGYYTDTKEVPAELAVPSKNKTDNFDIVRNVYYHKLGNIVPKLPNGSSVPGIPSVQYKNDPDDPTKVIPDEDVPKDPNNHFIPEKDTVTPTDPGRDTLVMYHVKSHTRTITFKGLPNTPDPVKTTVPEVDDNGNPGNYPVYTVPTVKGYKPDKTTIPSEPSNQDRTYTVTYTPVAEEHTRTIIFKGLPDNEAIHPVIDKEPNINSDGSPNSYKEYQVPNVQGYKPDKTIIPSEPADQDRTYTVTYTPVAEEHTRTIIFKGLPDNEAMHPVIDKEPNINPDGSPNRYKGYQVPNVQGYTPDKTYIAPEKADHDVTYTITYTPEAVHTALVNIKYRYADANGLIDKSDSAKVKGTYIDTNGHKQEGFLDQDGLPGDRPQVSVTAHQNAGGAWVPDDIQDIIKANKDGKYIPFVDGYAGFFDSMTSKTSEHGAISTYWIVYRKDTENKVQINFVDQDNNNKPIHDPLNSKGAKNDPIKDPTDIISSLTDKGYELVSDPLTGNTQKYNGTKQYTIVFRHGTTDVGPDPKPGEGPDDPINPKDPDSPKYPDENQYHKTYTYTVHFVDKNGTQVAKDATQTAAWGRTLEIDKVTGKVLNPDAKWTLRDPSKPNYDATNVPVVKDYVASKTSVNGQAVSSTLAGIAKEQKDAEDTIVYSKIGKIVPVGEDGTPIPDVPNPQYTNDPKDPTKVNPNEPVPNIPGKTPKTPTVTPEDPTKDTHVPYTDNAVDSNVTVIVHDDTANKDLPQYGWNSGTVKSGTDIKYNWPEAKKTLEDHGYVVEQDPVIPSTVPRKPLTIRVNVKHGQAPVNNTDHKHNPDDPINPNDPNGPKWPNKDLYAKDYTYTVNFINKKTGQPMKSAETQTSHWNRTLIVDKVTGEILNPNESWSSDITNYKDVKVPVENGFVAEKKTKNGQTVTSTLAGVKAEQKNLTDTVYYNTIGKIIPIDENGTPISNVPNPQYKNDPDDPTKVIPNEPVPSIPGKTPKTPTVTPEDPTKNTYVTYINNAVDSNVKVIVHDDTIHQDLPQYSWDSGTVKSGTDIKYNWPETKKKLEDHGYVIEQDPVIPSTVPRKPLTIRVNVKHGQAPVNNTDHKHNPNDPINPNDPNGPKWPNKDLYAKDYTYTVNFINKKTGQPMKSAEMQTSHWNRTLIIDKVTGAILNPNEAWSSDITNYKAVKVPVETGFVAEKKTKNGQTVSSTLAGIKAEPKNLTDTVYYDTIGRIIPIDENGKPIPGADHPQYKNDPNDPTKVIVTNTPGVEGYTATQKSVDPKDPVKDTKVKYTKNLSQIPDNPHDYGGDAGGKANDNLYDGDKDHKKKPAEKAKIKKPQQGPAKQAARGGNGPAKQVANNALTTTAKANVPAQKASAPADHIVQAATIAPAKHAAEAKTLPQTGSKNDNLAILGVSAMLASATMATMLYEAKRKRKA